MQHLKLIDSDLYDISLRLKEIDTRYILYYNLKTNRFEVHTDRGLELVLPYKELDKRALDHVLRTRLDRAKELIEEIDRHNLKLEKERARQAAERACESLEEALWK
ncbi:MAG: hypothetical protein GX891_03085 [Clostridiales bacterium]|nr:hypothetical protein [Clostridiales bacterium]